MAERYDFVIFGASGFTGKYVVREVAKLANEKENITWAVAGRSEERIRQALAFAKVAQEIPIILADIKNQESINNMAASAKVVINCCGPYRFLGEFVVKACVAQGAHHVDVSGEPQYMETMQLKYNEAAKEAGVYIISACGFDSIPTDLGVIFLQDNFKGQLNSVETYVEASVDENVPRESKAIIHYTTYESAVHGIAAAGELPPLRRQLYPERLPPLKPKLKARSALHKSDVISKWCLPFPGSDRSVVLRSQRFLFEQEKKRPVQIGTYVAFSSLFSALLTAFLGVLFNALASFSLGRRLLLVYPEYFSAGAVSHEGPSEEVAEATNFSVTIVGQGWSESLAEPLDNHTEPPDSQMIVRVSGKNPGYGATAAALVISAWTVLRETDRMPNKGGVLPPGAAFSGTSFVSAMNKFLKVEILDKENMKMPSCHSFIGGFIQDLIGGGIYYGGVLPPGAAFIHTNIINLLNQNGITFQVVNQSKL